MLKTLALALALSLAAGSAGAQQAPAPATSAPTIKRTPLQKFDVTGTNFETVIGLAEIVPNANVGKHTHPGAESGYLLEGDFTLIVQGQPDRVVKAGESYLVAAGVPHDAKTGPQGAKVLATYVVEKGKPLASPVQ